MSANKSTVRKAGFYVYGGPAGLYVWRLDPRTTAQAQRFDKFFKNAIAMPVEAPGAFATRLVALDGVLPTDLKKLDSDERLNLYQAGDQNYIEWFETSPPHTERRSVSALTILAWRLWKVPSDKTSGEAERPLLLQETLSNYLNGCDSYRDIPAADRVTQLSQDALCWWHQHLPAPLWAHLADLHTLSALPKSALARLGKQMPLRSGDVAIDTEVDGDEGATAEFVDAACSSCGLDSSAALLTEAESILKDVAISKRDVDTKRLWLARLLPLKSRAMVNGGWVSLLLGWLCNLIENGTSGKTNLALSTIRSYFSIACRPLLEFLRTMPKETDTVLWSTENVSDHYLGLLMSTAAGSQKTMASALSAWHAFLVDWIDVPPLNDSLHKDVPMRDVAAQVVWNHELAVVHDMIRDHLPSRHARIAQVVVAIASNSPVRTNEICNLRLRNLTFCRYLQGQRIAEIEIKKPFAIGGIKTPAAQRRLTIRDRSTIRLLLRWMIQRRKEKSRPDHLLFGDANDGTTFARRTQVVHWINRLLKAATGESGVSLHTLRHTVYSSKFDELFRSSSCVSLNRFFEVSVEGGHACASTSFTSYAHIYESGIRLWLDIAIINQINSLTSFEAESISQQSASALRQHARRWGKSLGQLVFDKAAAEISQMSFPSASQERM